MNDLKKLATYHTTHIEEDRDEIAKYIVKFDFTQKAKIEIDIMSYEPTLIIRQDQLANSERSLDEYKDHKDEDISKAAKYLLNVLWWSEVHNFDGIRLVLCTPDISSFNETVRDLLDELGIDYRKDN